MKNIIIHTLLGLQIFTACLLGYFYGKCEQLNKYVDMATVATDDSEYRTLNNPDVVIKKK